MHLLNTITYKLHNSNETKRPDYAALSHTWYDEDDEILYADMMAPTSEMKLRPGYAKMIGACREAQRLGLEWIWMDTCCIDKTSSAALSEAINSMWSWYRDCKACLVYLVDVPQGESHPSIVDKTFAESRWFKRGWTLQELIAPSELFFYDENWHMLGSKLSLLARVSSITTIPEDVLGARTADDVRMMLHVESISHRMSWAAGRQTTRIEDRAYSLLGIFDINMPLLYGEGNKAFRRLQEEIIRASSDQTLLTWKSELSNMPFRDVLAPSPEHFARGAVYHSQRLRDRLYPWVMTNLGLLMTAPLLQMDPPSKTFLALLGVRPLPETAQTLEAVDYQVEAGPKVTHRSKSSSSRAVRTIGACSVHVALKLSGPRDIEQGARNISAIDDLLKQKILDGNCALQFKPVDVCHVFLAHGAESAFTVREFYVRSNRYC